MLRFSFSETDTAPPKQILEASGDAGITQARRLRRVIKKDNHHYLLAIRMLTRASAVETLPLFLDSLVGNVLAIVISVTAVLFFGERRRRCKAHTAKACINWNFRTAVALVECCRR